MVILAIDASSDECKIGIRKNGENLCRKAPAHRRQMEVIFPLLDGLLESADVKRNEIQSLIVPVGPGSFTGIRLTMTVGRAISAGLNVKLFGISSLKALAYTAARTSGVRNIAVATDAKRNQVYFGAYSLKNGLNDLDCVTEDSVSYPSDVNVPTDQTWATAGDGWLQYKNQFIANLNRLPFTGVRESEISDVLLMAEKIILGKGAPVDDVKPIYLRHPVK